MKNKIVIALGAIILGIMIYGFIYIINKPYNIVTIDINPSIQLNLDKNNIVKKVIAINNDAKEIVSEIKPGLSLDETISNVVGKVIEKDLVRDNNLVILMHGTKEIDTDEIRNKIKNDFDSLNTEIIPIDNITNEDIKYAKKNDISPAKAAYINEIAEDEGIDKDILVEKGIDELIVTKGTGFYCNTGYTLSGNYCEKELRREPAKKGMICPEGYTEENSKCYKEGRSYETGNLICRDDFTKEDNKCIRTHTYNAEPVKYTCSKGEAKTRLEAGLSREGDGDAKEIVCVDMSNATHPVSPCELPASDPTERKKVGGKCYWHRAPVIAEGCPGKIRVGGECWDDATNILICAGYRDGKQYKSRDEYCEHSIKYLEPNVTEYKCEEEFARLEGSKCIVDEIEELEKEMACESGYAFGENGRCIDKKDKKDLIEGYYCESSNAAVEGSTCIIKDIIEANHN